MNQPDDLKCRRFSAVLIGTSAGGVQALSTILSGVSWAFRPSLIIVLHQPSHTGELTVETFKSKSVLPVSEAESKELILPGHIYFAPGGYHLLVESDKTFSLSTEEPVNFSRPSIDALFESAADAYKTEALGIILSGANEDGALGLRKIVDLGGAAIIQNPEEASYATMPLAAQKKVPRATLLELDGLSRFLSGL